MTASRFDDPLTYGRYLRIPELTDLQNPLAEPPVHDEMLFIIGQQAEELWFKQILFDLRIAVDGMRDGELDATISLLDRINRILRVLAAETEILESIPPAQFQRFRGVLKAASGLESEQFRELELASGLRDDARLKLASRLLDLPAVLARWPLSLRDALNATLGSVAADPVDAVVAIYSAPDRYPQLYRLCEALSEYDLRLQGWRFHHLQVVERVIGDRSPGTAGSAGSAYLFRTLAVHFFPALWEARNRLTAQERTAVPAGDTGSEG